MNNIIEQINQIIATIEPLYAEATKQCQVTEKPYKDLNVKMKKAPIISLPDYEKQEAELERLYKIYDKTSEKAYVLETVRNLLDEASELIEQYLCEYEG